MSGPDVFAALWALMIYNLPVVANVALSGCVCVILGCRVAKMTRGVTSVLVFLQHAILAIGMFGSVLLSFVGHSEWGAASASAGAMVFLLMSMKRWRGAPPAGTNKAHSIRSGDLLHAVASSGGKR